MNQAEKLAFLTLLEHSTAHNGVVLGVEQKAKCLRAVDGMLDAAKEFPINSLAATVSVAFAAGVTMAAAGFPDHLKSPMGGE